MPDTAAKAHIWLDSNGRAWIDQTNVKVIEVVLDHLAAQGISCDLIDLRSVRPIDWPMIEASVRRTGRLLAIDSGHETGGVAGEIVAHVATKCWGDLRSAPDRLAMPDFPEATSPALTEVRIAAAMAVARMAVVRARTRAPREARTTVNTIKTTTANHIKATPPLKKLAKSITSSQLSLSLLIVQPTMWLHLF